MSEKVDRLTPYVITLAGLRPSQRKTLLSMASKDQMRAMEEVALNIVKYTVFLSEDKAKVCRRWGKPLRLLVLKRYPLKEKRKILQQGGFIGAILPILASVIGLVADKAASHPAESSDGLSLRYLLGNIVKTIERPEEAAKAPMRPTRKVANFATLLGKRVKQRRLLNKKARHGHDIDVPGVPVKRGPVQKADSMDMTEPPDLIEPEPLESKPARKRRPVSSSRSDGYHGDAPRLASRADSIEKEPEASTRSKIRSDGHSRTEQ
ncbi:hypothetical protein RvY_02005 [Ramazzottius varieornatus]|uniref:Uncharacterized protein n=1 Tax=Ramazzottius varieornatus TaxID=947166 RepID=A0A1D1UIC0_RAMVA|nr:hypothetical protein RvY_02005 [Ramazzottius varieornatus]